MAVRYRFAAVGDEDALARMHTRSWQAAYRGLLDDSLLDGLDPAERAQEFRSSLDRLAHDDRGVTWIVAESDGRVVGHVLTQFFGGEARMHQLYLDPDVWGTGIGHALHDMGMRGLHRYGARHATLDVLDGNQRAIDFYERHGWSLTGSVEHAELFGVPLVDRQMAIDISLDVLARNRQYWTGEAVKYREWQSWTDHVNWGIFGLPDDEVGGIFPDVTDQDVVELGCGTAYLSNWALQRGARTVIGLDYTPAQLATAGQWAADAGVALPLVNADAHRLPFADDSFDLAINEYGAAIWCDPRIWIPEAARVLRPGGRIWFLGNSIHYILCAPEFEDQLVGPQVLRPQRDMHRFEWLDTPNVEFHVSHGEMIAILTGAGFVIEALHELYAPPGTPEGNYGMASGDWASKWPIEEVWVARLPD